MILNALSIDVEDWFHILDLKNEIPIADWHKMESRVSKNTIKLLSLFSQHGVRATFFVLGWVAEQFPQLVLEIKRQGHEIASHGYGHKLAYQQTPQEFRDDVTKVKRILERIIHQEVMGYRVPGFSIQNGNLWALDILKEEGFVYDSSICPAVRGHGGLDGSPIYPYKHPSGLWEFPISVFRFLGKNISFSGGGYLRFFPYSFIKNAIKKINSQNQPVMVYLHPREIDVSQPRLKMPLNRRFKCYVNLHTTEKKLDRLLRDFNFASISEVLGRC